MRDIRSGRCEIPARLAQDARVLIHVENAEALPELDGLEVRVLQHDDQPLLLGPRLGRSVYLGGLINWAARNSYHLRHFPINYLIESGAVYFVGVSDVLFVGAAATSATTAATDTIDGGVDVLLLFPLLVLLGPALLPPSFSHRKRAGKLQKSQFDDFHVFLMFVIVFSIRGLVSSLQKLPEKRDERVASLGNRPVSNQNKQGLQ